MINLCDICGQSTCPANTKNVVFSDDGDIIKCNKYNPINSFSSINLVLLFPSNLTSTEQKNIIENMSPNDIDNFFNCLNKIMKNLVEKIDEDEEEEE